MGQVEIVDRRERMKERLAIALIAFSLGVPAGAVIVHKMQPIIVIDQRMERVCGWPKQEGEFLWVMIEDGKVKCGRYK